MRHHSLTISLVLAGVFLLGNQGRAQTGATGATGATGVAGTSQTGATGATGGAGTPQMGANDSPWPKTILTSNGTVINLYEPQVLSYTGTTLQSRSVISVLGPDDDDPLFGVAWTTATVTADTATKEVSIKS